MRGPGPGAWSRGRGRNPRRTGAGSGHRGECTTPLGQFLERSRPRAAARRGRSACRREPGSRQEIGRRGAAGGPVPATPFDRTCDQRLCYGDFHAYRRRGVAQPGSAPALGAGCRRFESSRPDFLAESADPWCRTCACSSVGESNGFLIRGSGVRIPPGAFRSPRAMRGFDMVGVAQLAEHRVVVPGVAGSSPVTHPIFVGSARRPTWAAFC